MRKRYEKSDQTSEVIYGESLSRLIHQDYFSYLNKNSSVLFVSTQSFYEYYYEKFVDLFDDKTRFYWYVCPTLSSINSLSTYQDLLNYIDQMKLDKGTIIIGAGHEKIYHLCGFLSSSSPYITEYTYIATSMTGFIEALEGKSLLLNDCNVLSAELYALPERLIYDTMLSELETEETWYNDLFNLICLGIFSNNDLFNLLMKMTKYHQKAWTPYIELVMECLEKEDINTRLTFASVVTGFYQLTESHYMTLKEKEQVSFLIYFYWCLKKEEISFDYSFFIQWLRELLPTNLTLPIVMNTYDLAESIIKELNRNQEVVSLKEMGAMKLDVPPTLEEMYHVIESYREI